MQAPEPDNPTALPMAVCRSLAPVLIGACVRSAVQSACLAGMHPIAIDQFGDQDTQKLASTTFRIDMDSPAAANRLSHLIHHFAGHPVFLVSGWQGMLDGISTDVPTPQAYRQARSRHFVEEVRRRFGFHTEKGKGTFPMLRKDRDRSGGLGVQWQIDQAEVTKADCFSAAGSSGSSSDSDSLSDSQYFERWQPGRSCGACFVTNGHETSWIGTTRSLHLRNDRFPFIYCGSVGPIEMKRKQMDLLHRAARWIAQQCCLKGFMNLDFLLQKDGTLVLLEINPRWSASCEVLELAWRTSALFCNDAKSLFALGYELARGGGMPSWISTERDQVMTANRNRWYKRIVYARNSMEIGNLEMGDQENRDSVGLNSPSLPKVPFSKEPFPEELSSGRQMVDIPLQGQVIQAGEPLCTFLFDRTKMNNAEIRQQIRWSRGGESWAADRRRTTNP